MTYNIKPPAALWRLADYLDYRKNSSARGSILPTYADVARFIGVHQNVLVDWFMGRSCPSRDKHIKIILAAAKYVPKH
jgi:uncharacterized membrane protein YkvA (DUF1232 family)